MNSKDKKKKWIEENIIRSTDGHLITGQSKEGFKQSVRKGFIKPYVKLNRNPESNKATHLFLKEDLENYKVRLTKRATGINCQIKNGDDLNDD